MKNNNKIHLTEYFEELETEEEYEGYFCSLPQALTIIILGSLCGLENMKKIHLWASSERTKEFLKTHFDITHVPCYYWLLVLIKMIKVDSLNKCFTNWVTSMLPEDKSNMTVSFDGKTVRSTNKLPGYKNPLHIVSAHVGQLGLTFGSLATEDKSNEIPAVRKLIEMLDLSGCMIVADALNCQKETAKAIIESKADYLLSVKDNHETLKTEIEDYVQDDALKSEMDKHQTIEKNRGRIENRTAYFSTNINWLESKDEWKNLTGIGAVHTKFTTKGKVTEEWHYYISSRELTAEELLKHARLEWSVETMHWLLDVHYREDFCRVEDKDIQKNLNIVRKIALNVIKDFKNRTNSKLAISNIMFDCLLDPHMILKLLTQ
jgi:predicted transposase YbfD/YdcC